MHTCVITLNLQQYNIVEGLSGKTVSVRRFPRGFFEKLQWGIMVNGGCANTIQSSEWDIVLQSFQKFCL